ncbi:uncharacterized protein LOC106167273 [Lingula anatina]|uniref:dihydroneopterin aldolase n=1 Tax=Lingula anatina TaxID=7574 RepID=A0A1S3IV90_LINAN|nr:uncharacterized protein LOC106167273 [Lingula anatina]|eukprot:XP_013401459.1 uncharacterized protein LOC106167273 [Lingula anatina]
MATMDNLDLIEIKNLRPRMQIGISPHELGKKQEVVINLTLGVDIRRAAETDDIKDTLNYKSVTKKILEYAESTDIYLVEKLAEDIAKICIVCFRVPWVQVAVEKPHALRFCDSVGVKIRRTSKDYPHPSGHGDPEKTHHASEDVKSLPRPHTASTGHEPAAVP